MTVCRRNGRNCGCILLENLWQIRRRHHCRLELFRWWIVTEKWSQRHSLLGEALSAAPPFVPEFILVRLHRTHFRTSSDIHTWPYTDILRFIYCMHHICHEELPKENKCWAVPWYVDILETTANYISSWQRNLKGILIFLQYVCTTHHK